MLTSIIAASIALAGPPLYTYEDAWLDFIDKGSIFMAVRVPTLSSGDPTYSGSNPNYTGSNSLQDGSNPSAIFYGTHAKEIADFMLAGVGVRAFVTSNSQWSGGPDRQLMGAARTWPMTFSALPVTPVGNDPFYVARRTTDLADYMISGSWNNSAEATDASSTVGVFMTDQGIGDPGELFMPYMLIERDDPDGQSFQMSLQVSSGNAQSGKMYNAENWGSASNPANFQIRHFFVAGGNTDAPDDVTFVLESHTAAGGARTTNKSIADLTALTETHTLSSSNNSAIIGYADTDIVENGASDDSFRPRSRYGENSTQFTGLKFINQGGMVRRMNDDDSFEDGFSIVGVRFASGNGPCTYIPGTGWSDSSATRYRMGSNFDTRVHWMKAMEVPNVLIYDLGHNALTRGGSGFLAQSTWQADLFDLAYIDGTTLRDGTGLLGELPYIVLRIPWYAGSLDQERHDEIIGVCDALESRGFKVLVIDSFNDFDGEDFTPATTASTDWTTATTFKLDGDNDPASTGVHPADEDSARIAAYSIWRSIVAASESTANGGRSRTRDGTRSR